MAESKEAAKQADTVPQVMPGVLEGKSEDAIRKLGERAQKILEKNPRVAKAFYSMIASVQLYNVALAAISDECLDSKLGEDSAAITFILQNSVRKITAKEFERSKLSQHIQQHVLEFMAMELSLEQERDSKVFRDEEEVRQGARREQPVAIGHSLVTKDGYFGVGRSRTLLLVGSRDVLKELTDAAIMVANANKQTAVCLLAAMKTQTDATKSGNTNQRCCELGQQYWVNFAASRRKVGEVLNRMSHRLRGNRLDLLVVEDLAQANDAGSSVPTSIRASGAQRTIRQHADQSGTAVICCLPMADANPEDKYWEKLEVYTDLRFVSKDSNDVIEIATRAGESWEAIPQTAKDPFDERPDEEHSGGLPLQEEGGREEPDKLGRDDAPQEHEEAGDD